MEIFLSSVISGYEAYRTAAVEAVETLGHDVVRAEDFTASPRTPQQACLAAVREADLVVLLMSGSYGAVQPSGLSATHEEYREARGDKPMLVFVESRVERDDAQQEFLEEVQAWSTGHYRAAFSSPDELRAGIVRALHDYELAASAGPADEEEMAERARALVEGRRRGGGEALLVVCVAGGPYRQVIRPAELEEPELARDLQREALFGDHAVLEPAEGTDVRVAGNALELRQRRSAVLVDESGAVRVTQPARRDLDRRAGELTALIEEDIVESLRRALRFAGWLLDRVDLVGRVTDVVVAVRLLDAGYMPWRTRVEHQASPNAGTMGMGDDDQTVLLTPARRHRQALIHDTDRLATDFATLLRRARRQ
jgi:hypothetical protein